MSARQIMNRGFRWLSFGAFVVVAGAMVAGCQESSAQAEPASDSSQPRSAEAEPASGTKAPAAELGGQSSYKEEAFHLSISAPEGVKAGQATTLKVVLEAQSGFKVNQEYPLKFKFADVAGVAPAKKTVRKGDAKVEKKKAEIPLSVTIKAAGKHKVSGKLSFSVCTDERCLIEKRELTVDVTAS